MADVHVGHATDRMRSVEFAGVRGPTSGWIAVDDFVSIVVKMDAFGGALRSEVRRSVG
jgi:hypothetical protein